jgi:hypothetical protein
MEHLHWLVNAGPENVVRVDLKTAANVMLLDDINYSAFRRRAAYRYHGGYYKRTPVHLSPPRTGRWHVVVHLGGYAGRVAASVAVA